MTCREFVEFLMDYDSGELSEAQRAAFDSHMEDCPPCVAYVETYRRAVELGKAAFEATDELLPEDVPEELVQSILDARGKKA